MNPFKKDDATKLTAEVDRLSRKREALSAKLVAAQSAEASAREAQRKFFVETENLDASDAARLSAAVASAVSDVAAVTDAIQTVDGLIDEGKAAVTAAKEGAARQRRASEIAKRIERLEPLAAQAERQFESLVATLEKIAGEADDPSLDVKEYRELQGHVDRLPVQSIIGASLAQAIFRDMPDLMTVEKSFGASFARAYLPMMITRYSGLSRDLPIDHGDENSFTPKPLSGALQSNLIEPLRAAAAEILDGTRPLASNKPMIEADDDDEPTFSYPWVVFVKPARWRDWKGEMIEQADARAMVPQPVADAALKAGVAFPENAPEATAYEELRYQRGFHSNSINMSKSAAVDLNVKWPATTKAAA